MPNTKISQDATIAFKPGIFIPCVDLTLPVGSQNAKLLAASLAGASLASVAALRSNAIASGGILYISGYATPGDGGGGLFVAVPSDTTSADDGGTIIVDAAGQRWYRNFATPDLQLLWFCGSGAADFAPALAACFAVVTTLAATRPGVSVQFPAQAMNFNSAVTFTFPAGQLFSLTIKGAAADASVMNWPTTGGLIFNMSQPSHSIHLRDLTMAAGSVNTMIGLQITQTFSLGVYFASDFTRVNWRGTAIGAQSNCWHTAALIIGLSNYNAVDCSIDGATISGVDSGIGFLCQGSTAVISVEQNFTGSNFTFLADGVIYGDYLQGMTLAQCNFTSVTRGIHQSAGAGATVIGAQLAVNGCQFNAVNFDIFIEGKIGDVTINGSLFYSDTSASVSVFFTATSSVVRCAIVGNAFEGNNTAGTSAITFSGMTTSVTISGNTIFGFVNALSFLPGSNTVGTAINGNTINGITTASIGVNLAGTNSWAVIVGNSLVSLGKGVSLGTNATNCNVQSNSYFGCTVNVANMGTGNTVGGGSA